MTPEGAAIDEIIAREHRANPAACLSRGWESVIQNFWSWPAASLAAGLIHRTVPLLHGVLTGGLFWIGLWLLRAEQAGLPDAYAGFNLAPVLYEDILGVPRSEDPQALAPVGLCGP